MIRSSKKTAAKRRAEQKVIGPVRLSVAIRDGFCRLAKDRLEIALGVGDAEDPQDVLGFCGSCGGVSEWAHAGDFKRFKTRHQSPEIRHQTTHSLMLCSRHHRQYDANQFDIVNLTEAGADGPLAYRLKDSK